MVKPVTTLLRFPLLFLMLTALLLSSPPFPKSKTAAPTVKLTEEERSWLALHPEALTLFFNVEFPPIEFASPSGTFTGMAADIVQILEERLGVTFQKKPSSDWHSHLLSLKNGGCAVAPTIVATPEREKYAFFSAPYATAQVVIITSSQPFPVELSLKDLRKRRVAVVSGYATEQYLLQQGLSNIVPVKNVPEGLHRLSFGQVDAFVENLAVAAYYVAKEGIPNLRVSGKTDYSFAWRIAVSKRYPLLFSAIQKALATISEKELERVRKRWIAFDLYVGPNPEILFWLKFTALFALLLLLSLTAITLFLKRRLNEKVLSLRQSEAKYRLLFTGSRDGIAVLNDQSRFLDANASFCKMLGYTRDELLAMPDPSVITSEKWLAWEREEIWNRRLLRRGYSGLYEKEYKRKDGTTFPGELQTFLASDPSGGERYRWSIVRDITDRKRAEEERRKLQGQLTQAQKMESIGRLAGGVAHDFNNMLGVILGHAELALRKIDPDQKLAADLQSIRKAAERSADLTRQLLAFARKQTVSPKVLDLNETVEGMLTILHRLIGEDIKLIWLPSRSLGPIKVDPTQIDQILANLCVNARDAIHGIGDITIATKNSSLDERYCSSHPGSVPGQYVQLTVSDTGCGMDEKTLSNLFEPFFTTKEMGKGTGLGLAMVYGIVKQNKGFIDVTSVPSQGTVFTIFFPFYRGDTAKLQRRIPQGEPPQGNETVLLVEDETEILEITRTMLESQGYTVLATSSPAEALTIAKESSERIRLLMTDVVMPEMNGRDLSKEILSLVPDIKVLFSSGYPADVIAHHGVLDEEVNFIQKPFSLQELTRKVRETLGTGSFLQPPSSPLP